MKNEIDLGIFFDLKEYEKEMSENALKQNYYMSDLEEAIAMVNLGNNRIRLLEQQLIECTYQLYCMDCSPAHATSWVKPKSNASSIQVRTNLNVLNMDITEVKEWVGEE